MSQGNASAAIGLANTFKIATIGQYVQDITQPVGPGAEGEYIGVTGPFYWDRNWLGEDPGFLVQSTSGAATGKNAQWVTTGAASLTIPGNQILVSTGGTVTAGAGTVKTYLPAAAVLPAGSWFWAFDV
jgi:hypothetical protein